MKKTFLCLALSAFAIAPLHADTPVTLAEIPEAVTKTIAEYFPDAKSLSAKRDTDDGQTTYEVRVRYKAIELEVEVAADGTIRDVDMKGKPGA